AFFFDDERFLEHGGPDAALGAAAGVDASARFGQRDVIVHADVDGLAALVEAHGEGVIAHVDDRLLDAIRAGLGDRAEGRDVVAVADAALPDVVHDRAG